MNDSIIRRCNLKAALAQIGVIVEWNFKLELQFHVSSNMFYAKFLFLAIVATLTTAEYKIQGKIVNGHDASRGEFPFYVFLEGTYLYKVHSLSF